MIWNVPGIVIQAPSRLRPRRRLLVTHWPGPGPHCSDSELARADRLRYRSRVPRPVRRAAVSEPESGCQPECQARAAALRGTTRLARGLPILTDPPVRSEHQMRGLGFGLNFPPMENDGRNVLNEITKSCRKLLENNPDFQARTINEEEIQFEIKLLQERLPDGPCNLQ